MPDKPRKPWSEEAKQRWGERQRKLHAERKTVAASPGAGGAGVAGGLGNHATGGAAPTGRRPGARVEGANLLATSTAKTTSEKETKPAVDFSKLKGIFPSLLQDYNRLWDCLVTSITERWKFFKHKWHVLELTEDKAKEEAEGLYPLLEKYVPGFIRNHPLLSGIFIMVFKPILRIRRGELKKKVEVPSGQASDEEKQGTAAG